MSYNHKLEGIVKSFDEWIELGICPDCGGDLNENNECPEWYGEEALSTFRLKEYIKDPNNPNIKYI